MNISERVVITSLFDKYGNLLTQAQKQALALYLNEDLSVSEIAKILATTRQAAYYHIETGVKKLHKIADKIESNQV